MKKFGIIGVLLILVIVGLFMWSLSGASDSKAPAEVKTIDVSSKL